MAPGKKVRLKDHDTGWAQNEELKDIGKDTLKKEAKKILEKNVADLAEAQELLWASDTYALLIILQGTDCRRKGRNNKTCDVRCEPPRM